MDGEENRLARRIAEVEQALVGFSDESVAAAAAADKTDVHRKLWSNADNGGDKAPSLQDVVAAYAPAGLERQFKELYSTLRPGLVERGSNDGGGAARSNASAFIQGSRGSGKSLLLKRCLAALKDELTLRSENDGTPMFRMVHVNGIAVPGYSVQTVVREILQQLSDDAFRESMVTSSNTDEEEDADVNEDASDDPKEREAKRRKLSEAEQKKNERWKQLLRLKQTSFSNQLQLLNEILQLACVDGIPILFVLEELDTFTSTQSIASSLPNDGGSKERQVLLYHLLERVATQGSFCSFVGMTVNMSLLSRLEKRIKSRAEGTSKFIHTGPCRSFEQLAKVLLSKFPSTAKPAESSTENAPNAASDREETDDDQHELREEISKLLTTHEGPAAGQSGSAERRVLQALQRNYSLGKDMRWFSRVFYHALSVYRLDLVESQAQHCEDLQQSDSTSSIAMLAGQASSGRCTLKFQPKYLEDALASMGGILLKESGERLEVVTTDPRIQALCDLSGPQVALVLAARRILTRDSLRPEEGDKQPRPLTFDRMWEEYRSSYKGQSSRYTQRVLVHAFDALMVMGLLRPAADHTRDGPFQYRGRDRTAYCADWNTAAARMPLQLTVDIHREVKQALEKNLLHCSTALREWGRKAN